MHEAKSAVMSACDERVAVERLKTGWAQIIGAEKKIRIGR
jgi:hypothetical protein